MRIPETQDVRTITSQVLVCVAATLEVSLHCQCLATYQQELDIKDVVLHLYQSQE